MPSDLDATDTPMPSIGKEYGLVGKGPKASTGGGRCSRNVERIVCLLLLIYRNIL